MSERHLPNILITGTPGVGKTSLSILLADRLNEIFKDRINKNFAPLNISKLILDKKLYKNWNQEFDVPEFEDEMLDEELEKYVPEGGWILDFHTCDIVPDDWIDLVIIVRCNNTILYDRLKERGYNEKKIKENIECEIFEVIVEDVHASFSQNKIIELRSEKLEEMEYNLQFICKTLLNIFKI